MMLAKIRHALAGAFFWLMACLLVGAALLVVGTYLVAGLGAATLVAGLVLLGFSRLIFQGMKHA
jgi:hypothetical protein